jgi:hypothetical protein
MSTQRIAITIGFSLVCAAGNGCDDVQAQLHDAAHLDGPAPDSAVPDLAWDAAVAMPDFLLDPECPMGKQVPMYCVAGKGPGASCGPCTTRFKVCSYFEADLTCECDYQWHCSWCGGSNCALPCTPPDGGYSCVDGG